MTPTQLVSGGNSGYQAVNLAVLLGATRIVLLGYDCQPSPSGKTHFFGRHPHNPNPPPFDRFLEQWPTMVGPLQAAGVEVINATRETAIDCFPRMPLAEALCLT